MSGARPHATTWPATWALATRRAWAAAHVAAASMACGPTVGEEADTLPPTAGAATLAMVRRSAGGWPGQPEKEGSVVLKWGGESLEAAFTGADWVEVRVRGPGSGRASLWVDGTGPQQIRAAESIRRAALDPGRVHHLRLVKRTEPFLGRLEVQAITLAPGGRLLPPPPAPPRRLEVVGDSITSGYGALGRDQDPRDDALQQDAELAYGSVAARALGAEVRQIAWAGRTLLPPHKPPAAAPPPLRPMTDLWQPAARGPDAGHLDPSRIWRPQAVLTHLGTNDFLRGRPARDEVAAAHSAFVARLRRAYGPQALLVLAVGPMLGGTPCEEHRAAVHGTVEALRARGDARVRFLDFGNDREVDLGGVGRHPSAAGHRAMAGRLVDALTAWELWAEPAVHPLCGEAQGVVGAGLEVEASFQNHLRLAEDGPFCLPMLLAAGEAYDLRLRAAATRTSCAIFGGRGVVGPEGISSPVEVICQPVPPALSPVAASG